jgi:hypothetical protein
VIAMKRKRAATASPPADPELQALRAKWAPEWTVWRSRGSDGEPKSWCATRRDPSMTLMEPTADALEAALIRHPEPLVIHD